MSQDLSIFHQPIGSLFNLKASENDEKPLLLSSGQLSHFETNGFVSGVDLLNPPQIKALRAELTELFDPNHDGREFWYEYHSNESGGESAKDCTTFYGIHRFSRPHRNCSAINPFDFGTINSFANLRNMVALSLGTRTTPTGPAPNRCNI